jgi:HAD superfamily hydrolase (TIGR01549 family)
MHRQRIGAILFDMDGVLIDSYEAWYELVSHGREILGGPVVTRELFHAGWGQGVDADIKTFFPGSSTAAVARYYEDYFTRYARHVIVNPDACPVLQELKTRGIKTAVISNTPGPLTRKLLETLDLRADLALGGADAGLPKPAPDLLLAACKRFAVEPGQALMVGDSRFDEEAARAAAIRFAGFGRDGEIRLARLVDLLDLVR